MPADFLEILIPVISELCNLFNESFSLGIFPDHMKLAMVSPTFKGVSKLQTSVISPTNN